MSEIQQESSKSVVGQVSVFTPQATSRAHYREFTTRPPVRRDNHQLPVGGGQGTVEDADVVDDAVQRVRGSFVSSCSIRMSRPDAWHAAVWNFARTPWSSDEATVK